MLTEKDIATLEKPLTEEGLRRIQKLLAVLEAADFGQYAISMNYRSSFDMEEAVKEYKRFHLLVGFCLMKGVVPNLALTDRADRVWHCHLADKTNYEEFCQINHGVTIAHIEVSREDERPVKAEVYEAYRIMSHEIGQDNSFFHSLASPGFPYSREDEGRLFPSCYSGIA